MLLDSNGNATVEYTYGPDGLISQRRSSTSYYAGCDHLGSVWNLVTLDTDETIAASYTYTAFGNTTSGSDNTGNRYRYVGKLGYYVDDSGFLLLGARYYNPSIGRFITKDPIGQSGGLNPYLYANARPSMYVDPSGLRPPGICWVHDKYYNYSGEIVHKWSEILLDVDVTRVKFLSELVRVVYTITVRNWYYGKRQEVIVWRCIRDCWYRDIEEPGKWEKVLFHIDHVKQFTYYNSAPLGYTDTEVDLNIGLGGPTEIAEFIRRWYGGTDFYNGPPEIGPAPK